MFLSLTGARLNAVSITSNGGLFTSINIDTAWAAKLLVYFGLEWFMDMDVSNGTI